MHIYNWYQSIATVILLCTQTQITIYMAHSPCFLSPLASSLLLPFSTPFYLLGTLLAVTGSVHLGLRLLVNWPPLSQPFPQTLPPPNSQNPVYPGLTKTTLRRIRHLLSGTVNTPVLRNGGNLRRTPVFRQGKICGDLSTPAWREIWNRRRYSSTGKNLKDISTQAGERSVKDTSTQAMGGICEGRKYSFMVRDLWRTSLLGQGRRGR